MRTELLLSADMHTQQWNLHYMHGHKGMLMVLKILNILLYS